jgi:hypothetical protein
LVLQLLLTGEAAVILAAVAIRGAEVAVIQEAEAVSAQWAVADIRVVALRILRRTPHRTFLAALHTSPATLVAADRAFPGTLPTVVRHFDLPVTVPRHTQL